MPKNTINIKNHKKSIKNNLLKGAEIQAFYFQNPSIAFHQNHQKTIKNSKKVVIFLFFHYRHYRPLPNHQPSVCRISCCFYLLFFIIIFIIITLLPLLPILYLGQDNIYIPPYNMGSFGNNQKKHLKDS